LSLPLAQLQSLKSLKLWEQAWRLAPLAADSAEPPPPNSTTSSSTSKNSSHPQHGFEQLATLTTLVLSGVSVKLNGLPVLTGLQELKCTLYAMPQEDIEGGLIDAFPKL
jgi:hypothetical protein